MVASLKLLGQLIHVTPFFLVLRRLGRKLHRRRLECLVVAAEHFAGAPLGGLLRDVFRVMLASVLAAGRARRPQHIVLVGGLGRNVGDVRATYILIEAIHASLQISRVLLVPQWRLVSPPQTRLPAALLII